MALTSRIRKRWLWLAALPLLAGCAAVDQYERAYLADPIMDMDGESMENILEQKWLEAREGSMGGAGGAGGGCACN